MVGADDTEEEGWRRSQMQRHLAELSVQAAAEEAFQDDVEALEEAERRNRQEELEGRREQARLAIRVRKAAVIKRHWLVYCQRRQTQQTLPALYLERLDKYATVAMEREGFCHLCMSSASADHFAPSHWSENKAHRAFRDGYSSFVESSVVPLLVRLDSALTMLNESGASKDERTLAGRFEMECEIERCRTDLMSAMNKVESHQAWAMGRTEMRALQQATTFAEDAWQAVQGYLRTESTTSSANAAQPQAVDGIDGLPALGSGELDESHLHSTGEEVDGDDDDDYDLRLLLKRKKAGVRSGRAGSSGKGKGR